MTRTQAEADNLFRRLDDGYRMIEQKEQTSRDRVFLEDFWLSLLREYEAVCDELRLHEEREHNRRTQKGMFG